MAIKQVLLALLISAGISVHAAAAAFTLVPEASSTSACKKLGFVGEFSITLRSGKVYDVDFPQTSATFVVLYNGPDRYRMTIYGDWSEDIRIDTNSGEFSYSSGRPGRTGDCYGTIDRSF